MKKQIISIVIFVLMAIPAFSQINFGVKGGLNLSKLSLDNKALTYERGPGFDIGAFVRLGIGDLMYIQPEVMYAVNPIDVQFDLINGIEIGQDNSLKSIDIPINVGVKFGSDGVNIRAFAGPRFGFAVNKIFAIEEYSDAIKTSTFSFGGRAGVGIDFLFLSLDLLYDYSFTKGFEFTYSYFTEEMNPHLNCIKLQLGLKF